MKITVLGVGTFQPTPERGCPGYLLEIEEQKILLDAGSGCMRQLSHINVTPGDIDMLFFTHLHIDHTGDLMPLLFCRKNEKKESPRDIVLYGPTGFLTFFNSLKEIYSKWIFSEDYKISVLEYDENSLHFQGWRFNALPMYHSTCSFGFRIEADKGVFAYSGDTAFCENLIVLCKDADLAIIECTLNDTENTAGHMRPSEVGKTARSAHCRKVLLTHLSPDADEKEILDSCRQHFKGKIEIAKELARMII